MSNGISITKKNAIYLSLAAVLSISAMAIPMQAAHAQTTTNTARFLIQATGLSDAVQSITFTFTGGCLALCTVTVNDVLSHNQVAIPVTIQVGSVNVPVTVCGVAVLSSGTTLRDCTVDQDVTTTQINRVPITF